MATDASSPSSAKSTDGAAVPGGRPTVTVDIWSDVVCPWCLIGENRFQQALADLADQPGGGIDVQTTLHPFQLDPTAPREGEPAIDAYARKFGGAQRAVEIAKQMAATAEAEGLTIRIDEATRSNTFDAHRLIWWAQQPGSPVEPDAVNHRLMTAYFSEGKNIGDPLVLVACIGDLVSDDERAAVEAVAQAVLDSDEGAEEVRAELDQAAAIGITSVPTFVINGKWAVPGAQDPATFVNVLQRAAQ